LLNKTQLFWIFGIFVSLMILISYGFYEKHRKEKLYTDFKSNKQLMCGNTIVQRGSGWKIKNNRFFSNGKILKTIIFCKSTH